MRRVERVEDLATKNEATYIYLLSAHVRVSHPASWLTYITEMTSNIYGGTFPVRTTSLQAKYETLPQPQGIDDELLSTYRASNSRPPASAYPGALGAPLVDCCTNEWRAHPRSHAPSTRVEDEDIVDKIDRCLDVCAGFLQAPRVRRAVVALTILIILSMYVWASRIYPYLLENKAALAALNKEISRKAGYVYGTNIRPFFPGMKQIATLDPHLVPAFHSSLVPGRSSNRRLVFVGDIHGCKDELTALLHQVKFNRATDHLITTGDVINKGPDSCGVIDTLRELGASSVRGNHEDRILGIVKALSSAVKGNQDSGSHDLDHVGEKEVEEDAKERELATSLSAEQITYLESFPLILRIGEFKSLGEVVVVHAGLVPGVPLENQDPWAVMNMRVIDLDSHVPSESYEADGGVHWARLWNVFQKLLPSQQTNASGPTPKHTTIIYGHDARRGLQMQKFTKGLDSSCVRGGKLTALVLTDGGAIELVQVPCKDYRTPERSVTAIDKILQFGSSGDREHRDDDKFQ